MRDRIAGLDIKDGLAVAVGVYATRNLGSLVGRFGGAVTRPLDNIRAGLGKAAADFGGAWVATKVADMLAPDYKREVMLGGVALASSEAVASFVGQVDLFGGTPVLPFSVSAPAPKAMSDSAASAPMLPAPGASGTPGVPVPTSTSLLGYGQYGL